MRGRSLRANVTTTVRSHEREIHVRRGCLGLADLVDAAGVTHRVTQVDDVGNGGVLPQVQAEQSGLAEQLLGNQITGDFDAARPVESECLGT